MLRYIKRLVEARRQDLGGTELAFVAPLRSEAVDPRAVVLKISAKPRSSPEVEAYIPKSVLMKSGAQLFS
jgi:hypothetical protein